MSGELRLAAAREDADAMVGPRRFRRKDEGALRVVRLSRQRVHRRGVESAGLGEDEQLVAGKPLVGEDVEMDVAE